MAQGAFGVSIFFIAVLTFRMIVFKMDEIGSWPEGN